MLVNPGDVAQVVNEWMACIDSILLCRRSGRHLGSNAEGYKHEDVVNLLLDQTSVVRHEDSAALLRTQSLESGRVSM